MLIAINDVDNRSTQNNEGTYCTYLEKNKKTYTNRNASEN